MPFIHAMRPYSGGLPCPAPVAAGRTPAVVFDALSKPKERQDEQDDDDQADDVNDAVHVISPVWVEWPNRALGDALPPIPTLLVSAATLGTLAYTRIKSTEPSAALCATPYRPQLPVYLCCFPGPDTVRGYRAMGSFAY